MNRIKTYVNSIGRTSRTVILGLAVIFVSAGIAQAATTISTNIVTAGTLDATGKTTLGSATSTMFSAYSAYFGGSATSTFGSDGSLTLIAGLSGTSGSFSTTLGVTGQTTLGHASSTMFTAYSGFFGTSATSTLGADGSLTLVAGLTGTTASFNSTLGVTGVTSLTSASTSGAVAVGGNYLAVGGNATTSQNGNIATRGSLTVGVTGNAVNVIKAGYCVFTQPALTATTTGASTSCSTFSSVGAPITLTTADRVFVQATSSLPAWIIVQSAVSTAGTAITIELNNISTTTVVASGAVYSLNFWAFQ